jgi:hypothetical protein
MGYILEFRALPVDALVERLRSPQARTPASEAVARLIGGGGGEPDEQVAAAVVETVREFGTFFGSVQHSSSGGAWFRDEVLGGPVAEAIGADLTEHLLDRSLAGIRWEDYPSVGWATHTELTAGVARLDRLEHNPTGGLDEEETKLVEDILGVIRRTAASGDDLATVYT